ncbi:hypothetical protein [Candidatus Aciduliprofundum boonei]|uniref:Uncharacterized protein n=1 Tax=Aciduliprofundum boonei (strain DSM 19572 / T469) TaxID=439481 RepID=B5IDU0_ACIB4|nr:hypothetical protein [Candidatus Aciduliprofundum boonei]ADD08169.1 hypothetical protein Aboo_0358 [Aciduliprofundum boonei T469]EDY35514.1 hypothetical protein ABOONEI_797 [Aciduliprofundum boonei T469]EDY35638.1 hypothetical protein ABOONEI_175 [Aciduliprofundum boonei T469]HII54544.1 hypothetical protein [Candidatus Aciduliprofundum boonei]
MKEEIKILKSFLTVDSPAVLLTPCELKNKDWVSELNYSEIKCTSLDCQEEDKDCIKMNPQGLYLPLHRFHAWIIDPEYFIYTPGYAFYLGRSSLKEFGIIALTSLVDDAMDSIALSYGFQILHHGNWHYYLKAT